jgi:ABC-type lipoprotein export system ATPase subunit
MPLTYPHAARSNLDRMNAQPKNATGMEVFGLTRTGNAPLRRVSFVARRGETTVLLSPDGSGGAALRAALGFEPVDSGFSVIEGRRFVPRSGPEPVSDPERVGVLLRDPIVTPGRTLDEHLRQGLLPDHRGALGQAEVQELRDSLGFMGAGTAIVSELPLSLQYRVAIGRAIAARPAIVAADDPYGGLPERERHLLVSLLRAVASEHGIGVVHATGDVDLATRANHVVVIEGGRVTNDLRGTLRVQRLLGRHARS